VSIDFSIAGPDYSDEETLNLSNMNALGLLEWIGVAPDYCGSIAAKDLAASIRRRLWPEHRQRRDEGVTVQISALPGRCTVVDCGREAGYFQKRARTLLALAEKAQDGHICWG
jgi:hypothetical protein